MRNFILSFLFLCIPCLANAQDVQLPDIDALEEYIEFADANVKAICIENWDTNHDGELSYSEAAAVTKIGQVFKNSGITSFDELQYFTGLSSIGNRAFDGCSALTSIEIPNSVTSLGYYAFHNCRGLTSIEIPNSVTFIESGAFSGCGLTKIIVAPDNPVYDSRDNCNAIIETSTNTLIAGCMNTLIPNSVTSIGYDAFDGCSGLTSIMIPNSVTSINNYAFVGCSGLTNIIVAPDNPVYDSRNNCNAIIETSSNTLIAGCMNTLIPNSVTSIGDAAFEGCSGLTSIEIPNSVTSIGYLAFDGCTSLTSIEIPNSVTSIGKQAFYNCTSLSSIKISNSVTSIGGYVFGNCESLTSVKIPNSVTSIGNYVFCDCSGLKSIEIPNSVTSIGNYAFYYCTGLTSIEIPNTVNSIGNYAFGMCTSLTSVKIPNSVTSIGNYAFGGCWYLTSIEIPNSVTSIGDYTFLYCNRLTDVYCYAETLPSTVSTTFDDSNYKNATLHVPACAIDDYKTTEPWSGFGNIVPLEFDLTVSDAGVATLYLDYSVAIPDVEGMGDVMYVSDVVDRTLVLTKVENNIPAHTGVIVYAQPGTYTLTSSTTHVDACENSQLSGVTQDTPTANIDGTVYTLSVGKNPEDIGFRKFVGGTLAANKAFLVMNESNEVNFYNFAFDDELTGISTTEQDVDVESAVIYDLQGRRVTSPSKGIYIVNGQKRIINHR